MKLKNIFIIPFTACLASVSLVSCDGGGRSDSVDNYKKIIVELPANPNEAINDTGNEVDPDTNSSLEGQYADQIYTQINQERVSRGLSTLSRDTAIGDSTIDTQCSDHNIYMRENATPGGILQINQDGVQSRIDNLVAAGYRSFAENSAAHRGVSSGAVASEFVKIWVNSSEHLKIITGNYTHTGVAVTVDSRDGTVYATQIFGLKP